MVASLFSVFDLSAYISLFTWVTPFFILGLFLTPYLITYPSFLYTYLLPFHLLKPGLDVLLYHSNHISLSVLLFYLWVYLVLVNLLGLLPYIFTGSSHMSLSSCLALSLWVTFLQYGWGVSPGSMMKALVPEGTPLILMPFMVLIESISVAIRPLTLSVRLTANMIAGHLLLSLCAKGFESPLSISLTFMCQTTLSLLEVAVAAIQAYVFTMLISLYSSETSMNHSLVMLPAPHAGVLIKLTKHCLGHILKT